MAPTVVLIFPTTTHTTIMSTTHNTLQQNNISTIGGSGGSAASTFGVYQQTAVGLSDLLIRTLVPDPISVEPYRKALIAKLFFRQILSLADSPSVELNDLLFTVASYFCFSTGSAERDANIAAQSISRAIFRVSNLTGVGFSDATGKILNIPDVTSRPADLAFFTFRSHFFAPSVDIRAPNKSLNLEFSLRLPQSLSYHSLLSTGKASIIRTPTSQVKTPPPSTSKPPQTVEALGFTLGNLSDDILSGMTPVELRNLLITARKTITVPSVNLFLTPPPISTASLANSATPKMDRVRSVALSGGVMKYTGPLDFLDSQSSFDAFFGTNPSMLRLTSCNKGVCASEDTEYLRLKVIAFSNLVWLHIFCDSVQLKYVGTEDYDSQKMLADISLALLKLKMTYMLRNKIIPLTPDDLFSRFTEYLPLLSPNAMTWSFCLVYLYFHALPSELQEVVQLGGYVFPDISTLATSLLQEQALQVLREVAVVSFKMLLDETRRIRRIMNQNVASNNSTNHHLASNNNTSGSPTLAEHNHQGSAAE